MKTSTRTIAINAAFLQEIKEDNRELRDLLARGAETFAPAGLCRTTSARLVELLEQLCDQLAMHFALEEAYGYFEDAIDIAPALSGRADKLRREHLSLFSEACSLLDQCERMRRHEPRHGDLSQLAADFLQFHRCLSRHEQLEDELILASLSDETGVGG